MIKLEFSNFVNLLEEKQVCICIYDGTLKRPLVKNFIYDESLFDNIVELYEDYYVINISQDSCLVCCTLVHPNEWDDYLVQNKGGAELLKEFSND